VESPTRRRLSGMLAGVFACVCAASVAHAATGRAKESGIFALLSGTPKVSATLRVTDPAGLSGTLDIREFAQGDKPILAYDIDMEHIMHMIIIRDDFATFDHVHPAFNATTGTFSQHFTKEPNHRYYVYADTTPRGFPQQVFRFTLDSVGPVEDDRPSLTPSDRTESAGPYSITLEKTLLPAQRQNTLDLTVLKSGAPAADLAPYLGAAAHVVFINTSTLEYVHIHPMLRDKNSRKTSMSSEMNMAMPMEGKSGPFMQMELPALPGGTYKVWIQFMGDGKLYTVPFTLLAR